MNKIPRIAVHIPFKQQQRKREREKKNQKHNFMNIYMFLGFRTFFFRKCVETNVEINEHHKHVFKPFVTKQNNNKTKKNIIVTNLC